MRSDLRVGSSTALSWRCDELLAQRSDLENGAGPRRNAVLDIRKAIALGLDQSSVL
jgi:hypothetical protein